MSRYIATRAIRGANALVREAELMFNRALAEKGGDQKVAFPNTAYYLPLIYGMTGVAVEKLEDLAPVIEHAKRLLHPVPSEKMWTPYLGETLDSGMATLLAAETIEAIRFVYGLQPERMPGFTLAGGTAYPELDSPIMGELDISMVRSMTFNCDPGGFSWWMDVCPALQRSLAQPNQMKLRSRLCGNSKSGTSSVSYPAM